MDRTKGDNLDISSGVRKFTDGPPGTTVDSQWLNGIQEELIGVLVAAGIVPSATDNTQLLAAISALGVGFSQLANTIVDQGGGSSLKTKVIEIGDWDMNATDQFSVAHGLVDYKKIRSVSAVIRDDTDVFYYSLANGRDNVTTTVTALEGSIDSFDAININMSRKVGGIFDSASFDDVGGVQATRGWITIGYTE